MGLVIQVVAKVLLSGVLALVATACIWEIYRVWLDRTLILAPFDYLRDGQPVNEAGQQFVRLVQVDLTRLAGLYGVGRRNNEFAPPSKGMVGLGLAS